MGEEQDATWRFINLAPVTGNGQSSWFVLR